MISLHRKYGLPDPNEAELPRPPPWKDPKRPQLFLSPKGRDDYLSNDPMKAYTFAVRVAYWSCESTDHVTSLNPGTR